MKHLRRLSGMLEECEAVQIVEFTHFDCFDNVDELAETIKYYGFNPDNYDLEALLNYEGAEEFLIQVGESCCNEVQPNAFYYVGGSEYPTLEVYLIEDSFEWDENFESLPDEIAELFADDEADYNRLSEILAECEELGFTFDYGLDAVPFNLRPVNQ